MGKRVKEDEVPPTRCRGKTHPKEVKNVVAKKTEAAKQSKKAAKVPKEKIQTQKGQIAPKKEKARKEGKDSE